MTRGGDDNDVDDAEVKADAENKAVGDVSGAFLLGEDSGRPVTGITSS